MAANVVSQARGKNKSKPSSGALWENVKSIAGAVLIYLVIKTFLFESYRIPSGSMVPTLLIGDWLFVNCCRVELTPRHSAATIEPCQNHARCYPT